MRMHRRVQTGGVALVHKPNFMSTIHAPHVALSAQQAAAHALAGSASELGMETVLSPVLPGHGTWPLR